MWSRWSIGSARNCGDEARARPDRCVVKFAIQRDGTISGYEVETSSGSPVLDLASLRAVVQRRTLPPLPAQYADPTLTVHLIFEYR
jgi:TonB family protein